MILIGSFKFLGFDMYSTMLPWHCCLTKLLTCTATPMPHPPAVDKKVILLLLPCVQQVQATTHQLNDVFWQGNHGNQAGEHRQQASTTLKIGKKDVTKQ